MTTLRKFTALTLLFVFLAALACKNTDFPDPDPAAPDRDARSALSDTISTIEKPEKPVEEVENNNPPEVPDTTSAPKEPRKPVFVSLANEKFTVTAEAPDSLKKAGIFLTFVSERDLGCGDSYLYIREQWQENSPFEIRIGDLELPDECMREPGKAKGSIFLRHVPKGEHIMRIHVGDKSFDGKIIRDDTRYLFEWPDESPFRFSDKVLNF